jgi:hypothetical protein
MKNPEQLIGRKVRGFWFDDSKYPVGYISQMDKYIGKKGKIIEYDSHLDLFGVKFKLNKFWYPADKIHEHLVDETQTKFPKVWAWDDDVNQAFETYLIAENKEKEYPFLCVSRGNVNNFKGFLPFHSSAYKNISTTDPRLNDIITIVEKYGKDFVIKTVEKL